MRRSYFLILTFIFVLALLLRFYKLGEVPAGFYQDESAIGYNAYSILETGRDEYGKSFPLYFKSFGDYKLPVYIYLTSFSVKLFGLNEFAVRFPSALFGFLTVVVFFLFVKEISKDKQLAIISTALLAVNPWHLHYSRAAFEVSISLFLFVLGVFLIHKALFSDKKRMFFLGTLCFVLNIYTYNLTRLLSPLLFFLVIFIYRQQVKIISKKEMLTTTFVSAVLLWPFFTTLLRPEGVGSGLGTFILTSASIQSQLLEFRSYLLGLPDFFEKIFFNQLVLTTWQYLNNIASYFSVPFFFISGSQHGNHGIGNVGQFYLLELPLIIIGVLRIIADKKLWGRLLVGWAVLVILVASLTREAPHATRSFFLIAPVIVFSAAGLFAIWKWILSAKNNLGKISLIILISFVIYNVVYYFSSYYIRFPILYAKAWRFQDKALSSYIKEYGSKYDRVIFDKNAGFIYASLLFYARHDPTQFQQSSVREPDDSEGFSKIKAFGKYEFGEIDWSKDLKGKTLVVTVPEKKPDELSILKTFFYRQRPVVISDGQQILGYPIEEVAYVLVEGK